MNVPPKAPTQQKWDRRFLELAKLVSTWSKDPSTQVGAVIAGFDKRVVSVGFNGFPQWMEDDEALLSNREEKYSRIVHGEINALIFADRAAVAGATLYTHPFMPCDRCVVQLLQAGIDRFVAPKATDDQLARWGAAFDKTRRYIQECGAQLEEVDFA